MDEHRNPLFISSNTISAAIIRSGVHKKGFELKKKKRNVGKCKKISFNDLWIKFGNRERENRVKN